MGPEGLDSNTQEMRNMKARALVGALVTAGVVGTGAAAWHGYIDAPMREAHAATSLGAGVAAPAANPAATALPLNGFTELVSTYGPAVVNISTSGTTKASA